MPPAALRIRPTRVGVAALLIQALLFALFLSLAPQMHHRIHSDAQQSEHECVVTLITHGKCENFVSPPLVEPAIIPISAEQVSSIDVVFVAPQFLGGRILEHAPPALS